MSQPIVCREVRFDCDGWLHAATEDEAMASAAVHVKAVPELMRRPTGEGERVTQGPIENPVINSL